MSVSDVKARLTQADKIAYDVFGDNPPPGFALGVVHQQMPVFEWHYGYADLQARCPVTSDTVFRIGSISKMFTALAVMQLWERGQFGLNDPVNDYLKAFGIHPPNTDAPAITVHHLLSHTSGLGRGETLREFVDVYGHFTGRWETRFKTLNEFYGPRGLHPMIAAGEKYSYSNNGYAVLGQFVEDVTGLSFAEYMRQYVFTPLQMMASDVVMSAHIRPMMACGYRGRADRYVPIRATEIRQQGAGALLCSLKDMMTFLRAVLRRDERLLRAGTWELMLQPHWQLDPRLWGDAYGIQCYMLEGCQIYNQAGGAGGFNSNITFTPDHHLGVVALSNRTLTIETYQVTRRLLHHLLNAAPPDSEAESSTRRVFLSESELKPFVGYYAPSPGWKTNIDFYTELGFAGAHIVIDEGRLKMHTDFGRLASGIHLYRDVNDSLVFHGHLGGWRPFIFQRSALGQIDGLMFDLHHHLHRGPVKDSLKNRLKRLIGWGMVGIILMVSLLRSMSKPRS